MLCSIIEHKITTIDVQIFFEKITFSNILLVLLLRLLGSDVSYFELSRVLRKKKS